MKTKHQHKIQAGFSLIEVLVAMALLSMVVLGVGKQMLNALSNSQGSLNQTIAVEQLDGMANIILQFPVQYQMFLSDWNIDNQCLLPEGNGEVNASTITVTWRSGISQFWRCGVKRKENYSCLELSLPV